MSDNQVKNKGAATQSAMPDGMDGRMRSLARRQAMSLGGKAGASISVGGKTGAGQAAAQTQSRPTVRASEVVAHPLPVASTGAGEKTDAEDCGCVHTAEQNAAEQKTLEALCTLVETNPAALGESAISVRQLCQMRRKGLSNQGKTVLGSNRKERSAGGTSMNIATGLSGRAAAQARREALCVNGRGDSPACRPSGRVRSAVAEAPAKVEIGSTLSGNAVTGTQVERSSKVTGIAAGSCLSITGTEYIGTEQYAKLCTSVPAPAPAKVGSGSTSRGQHISGTELSRNEHITGDERGTGKRVTGSEYLNAEQIGSLTSSKSHRGSAKVGAASTLAGQQVSGSEVGRSKKVTGDEPGACLKLTGSQYVQPDASGTVCQGSGVPHKVSVMNTVRERPVTGTNVAASKSVTGSEHGACSTVTGVEYAGLEQYQSCSREAVLTPEKVNVSRTWYDQTISGTALEHNPKVTGDEYGGCQPISGTTYIGSGQYSTYCPPDSLAAAQARVVTPRGAAGESTTGVGLSSGNKVTGSARSSALRLSGTPYSDDSQYAVSGRAVSGAIGMNQRPLSRGPADRSAVAVASAQPPAASSMAALAPSGFSITPPARAAQANQLNAVSGVQGRITGPVNLALGLVSGTPEFRLRDENATTVAAPVAVQQANRVTGEGREAGFTISGDAWRRDGSTTGTEGVSATRRNPTLRGDVRGMAMQALASKTHEHTQIPPSRVTGSSGNTAAGSTITYSGGARG